MTTMKPTCFANDLSIFAAEHQPQLARLFREMEPTPWIARLRDWFDICHTDPAAAMSETALFDALQQLVSLMHARMQFGLLDSTNWGRPGELICADQRGGAIVAAAARADLMRVVSQHDRALAVRLTAATNHRIEEQRAIIAKHIEARQR